MTDPSDKRIRAERLRRAREEAGYDTAAAFAEYADIPEPTYRAYENGNRILTLDAARSIGPKLKKSWMYLMFGEEADMIYQAGMAPSDSGAIARAAAKTGRMSQIEELDATASAGDGQLVEHTPVVQRWRIPRDLMEATTQSDAERIKIIRVKGDSMVPTYNPVDRVMVDTGDTSPTPPGVFVVWDGLGFVIKRIEYIPHSDPPRVRISSDNEKYQLYERVLSEAYIQGRVIGKWLWT